ncbi:hypothetical protein [Agrobacterium cavarae]|uniref:hypothetical protein n=1 Tax=Agrobacterium cavarae TaxID=2528239 RepID=UPI003FD24325
MLDHEGWPVVYLSVPENRRDDLDFYHGTGVTSDNRIEYIGFRGKLYALYILERHGSPKGKSVQEISSAIVKEAAHRRPSIEPGTDAVTEDNSKAVRDAFRELLSATNKRQIPDEALSKTLVASAAVYFAALIRRLGCTHDRERIEIELLQLLSTTQDFPDVESCYRRLIANFGIKKHFIVNDNPPWEPVRFDAVRAATAHAPAPVVPPPGPFASVMTSWLDPDFRLQLFARTRTYPEEDGSNLDKIAKTVIGELSDQSRRKRLYLLQGAPHSGKKSVIAQILRDLAGAEAAPFLRLHEQTKPVRDLPVMAIVARSRDQNSLALYVRAFLQRLDDVNNNARPYWWEKGDGFPDVEHYHTELLKQAHDAGGGVSTERTLAEIARLSKSYPAFYLFADLDGLGRDSILKLLRGYDATRLLNILSNHRDTRLVISAYDRSAVPEIRLDLDESSVATEQLPNPAVERLDRYWSNGLVADPIKSELDEVWKKARRRLTLSQSRKPVEGECLVVGAAILQLAIQERERHGHHVQNVLDAVVAFTQHGDQMALIDRLNDLMIDIIEKRGLLPVISLIASAEDGILQGTLMESLRAWNIDAPVSCPAFAENDVATKLAVFKSLAGGFLLKQEDNVRLDEHEFGLEETDWSLLKALSADEFQPVSEEDVKGFQVWSFDPAVRISLIRRLQRPGGQFSPLFREANRIVARAARRRAQHKKVNLQTPFSMQPQMDSARDIQAYICLLASMTKEEIDGHSAEAALSGSTQDIFSLGGGFTAGVALRFAYFGLLREEIDRDYRLSMVSDQDILRLRLYLLLFLPLGSHHFSFVGDIAEDDALPAALPSAIPDHIAKTFDAEAVAALCATIAISAFHAHYPQVIDYVQDVLDKFLKTECSAKEKYLPVVASLVEDIAHVWLAKIDYAIAFRTGLDEAASILGELLDKPLFDHFTLTDAKSLLAAYDNAHGAKTLKVWMRLKFRQAELHYLNSEFEQAQKMFRELVDLDNFISSEKGLLEPVIFSGRTARRYIRYAFSDPLVGPQRPASSVVADHAKAMIEVNISRQRRYAGVDRVGVLIDLARRHASEHSVRKAVGYITKANIRARRGPMSYLARMELLACLSTIRIWCALSDEAEGQVIKRQFLKKARESATKLINLSTVSKSDYFGSVGTFLAAKAFVESSKTFEPKHILKVRPTLAKYIISLQSCHLQLAGLGETVYHGAIGKLIDEIENLPLSA